MNENPAKMNSPLPNGANGRDDQGRFVPGNSGGPGNPRARQVAGIRSALAAAISEADIKAIVAALVKKAKDGDTIAAREVLDRLLGKPHQSLAVDYPKEPITGITIEFVKPPEPGKTLLSTIDKSDTRLPAKDKAPAPPAPKAKPTEAKPQPPPDKPKSYRESKRA